MSTNTALILISHGSKNADWIAPFRQWAEDLRRELGPEAVYLCFMEIAEPKLMDVAREILSTPVRHARLLPLFLSKGSHFLVDIPRQMAEVNAVFPELEMELLEPIGLHPLFFNLMRQVIKSL